MKNQLKVGADHTGQRLDMRLTAETSLSRNQVRHMIDAGKVMVNGQAAKASYKLAAGDSVSYAFSEPSHPGDRPAPQLKVVYEDSDITVIDKPAGVLVHPHPNSHEPTVADFARSRSSDSDQDRPGIVHRLDRDTSGLLVIARTPTAKSYLQELFRDRKVRKVYLMLIEGRLKQPQAVINLPIGRSANSPALRQVTKTGRPAVTRYQVIKELPGYSLVEAELETGRTHQLRTHFAHLGHPIVGDTLYGKPKRPQGLSRQFLHAAKLEFTGPDGVNRKFASELPADLAGFLATAEKTL